jgi:hypothetical protein
LARLTSPIACTSIFSIFGEWSGTCARLDPERLLAHGERLPHAGALALDDDALEDLDAAALSLDHLEVHPHGVAGLEDRQVGSQLALLE